MKLFLVKFVGRKVGAIGEVSKVELFIENETFNEDQIIEKIYRKYEHCIFTQIINCEYVVLTANRKFFFNDHQNAFDFAIQMNLKSKGVYKVINSETLGAVNIFGSYDAQLAMEYSHRKQFNFKVI